MKKGVVDFLAVLWQNLPAQNTHRVGAIAIIPAHRDATQILLVDRHGVNKSL
jgi:hypothetical protein